jgi:hypothetical protein
MDEIDVLDKAIVEYKKARRLKNLNENLTMQLLGSIQYLLNYSQKYNIILPKKDDLLRMVENGYSLVQQLDSDQPIVNTNNNSREDNSTILRVLFTIRLILVRVVCRLMN